MAIHCWLAVSIISISRVSSALSGRIEIDLLTSSGNGRGKAGTGVGVAATDAGCRSSRVADAGVAGDDEVDVSITGEGSTDVACSERISLESAEREIEKDVLSASIPTFDPLGQREAQVPYPPEA